MFRHRLLAYLERPGHPFNNHIQYEPELLERFEREREDPLARMRLFLNTVTGIDNVPINPEPITVTLASSFFSCNVLIMCQVKFMDLTDEEAIETTRPRNTSDDIQLKDDQVCELTCYLLMTLLTQRLKGITFGTCNRTMYVKLDAGLRNSLLEPVQDGQDGFFEAKLHALFIAQSGVFGRA